MTTPRDRAPDPLLTAADRAVAALELLAPGSPFAEPLAAAAAALAALRAAAVALLFPDQLEPASAETLLDLDRLTGPVRFETAAAELAALHGQAYPALALAIRGPRGRHVLQTALGIYAGRILRPEAVTEGLAVFERAVAAQLVGQAEHEPAASLLAHELPALQARLDTARAAHEAHARAEADRLQREHEEAARVLAEIREGRRRALLARAEGVASVYVPTFPHGGVLTPLGLRDAIRQADDATLAELELAITGAEAARDARAAGASR
jgi:hypothetical protein